MRLAILSAFQVHPRMELHMSLQARTLIREANQVARCTGNFCIDDEALRSAGLALEAYAVTPGTRDLQPDCFVS
jgi:hypothetical protein